MRRKAKLPPVMRDARRSVAAFYEENDMRTRTMWIAFLVLIFGCSVASAADFAKGLDALDRGDYVVALGKFRPLAESGNARAEYRLGIMFAKGLGVPLDYKEAAQWLNKAAMQGNADAQNDLGVLYDLGRGVAADPKEAAQWFRKAAEQGIGAAQLNLASLYQQGRGVPLDPVEAFARANAASQLGEYRAQQLLDSIAKAMTPTQIDQAQRRAQQYREKYVAPFRKY